MRLGPRPFHRWTLIFSVAGLMSATLASPVGAAPLSQAPDPDAIVVPLFISLSPFENGGGELGEATAGSIETEIPKPKRIGSHPLRTGPGSGDVPPVDPGVGSGVASARKAKSNPQLTFSFEGVNHRDSRLADNGNQFSGEPADQGVCVGNGYIMETVNSALRVFSASDGTPLTDVLSLNQFYGFPPALDRSAFVFGPFTFDIYCHYDPHSNRWFHLAVDLEQHPTTGAFTGRNYVDLAVSTSGDPTGGWNVYRIPGMNDGTEGTPDHNCAGGPCFADFPHIGVDEHGVYITTNEFPLFADGFTGAQVYAISKPDLVGGAAEITAYLFDTSKEPWAISEDQPGFTVWPALSAGTQFSTAQNGTEFFVSSNAVFDDESGDSEEIIVWALANTQTLNSGSPSLSLTRQVIPSLRYAVPATSEQKPGTTPLRDCLNDTGGALELIGFPGVDCGALFGLSPQNEDLGIIDTSDSRVLDVKYAQNRVWAVLGTAVEVGGEQRTGVGWFIISPQVRVSGVSAGIERQGILAVENESLAYPTVGVTTSGRGVIGFTRVGPDLFPSQGYAPIDRVAGVGTVHMAAQGNSPQDGFTEYSVFTNRPRWGDYGAAAVDGNHVYLAGQYIQQGPCDLTEYLTTGLQCDDSSRTSLANWSTRVTKVRP